MLKQTAQNLNPTRAADAAFAASRQMWLASLGAAKMTRDWARHDAGAVFRSLVKEGSTVETRVLRVFGEQLNSSIAVATSAWNKARHSALVAANGLVDAAASVLPKLKAPAVAEYAAPKPKKAVSRKRVRKARRMKVAAKA